MEFRLLGPLEVVREGRPLSIGGHKQRVVLALLLLNANRVVSVDRLMDAMWGDEPPRTARNTLQTYVRHLRKVLGADRLQHRPPGYLLTADAHEIDAVRFTSLLDSARANRASDPLAALAAFREALALWRGPALDDFCFEPFAQTEIAALEEMRVTAIEDAAEADLAIGHNRALIGELQSLVREYPLRERLCGHLMIALYRNGRQAEALSAYRRARQRMVDELGVDPGPELRALEAAILRQDAELVTLISRPNRGIAGPVGPVVNRVAAGEPAFVGRKAELDRLFTILSDVAGRRRPAVVTVIGDPGLGKSRLAAEFVDAIGDEATVLIGHCEPDVGATFAPMHQMLAQVDVEPDDLSSYTIARLRELLGGGSTVAHGEIEAATCDVFATLSARLPVVLVLEDVHWAQPGLLGVIAAVAEKVESPVMTVCLARPELTDAQMSLGLVAERADTVELSPMSPAEVKSLLLNVAEPWAIDEIISTADGNPFFAMQLAAWVGDRMGTARSLPPAVRTLLANRISGLGPGEFAVIRSAAIIGRDFTLSAVTSLLSVEAQSTMERHLSALERRLLVQPTSSGYRFRHHLIHRAAYLATEPSARAQAHEQHAEWLIESSGADPTSAEEVIGFHFEQAHDSLQALGTRDLHARRLGARSATHLGAAGRRATRRVDLEGAARFMTRALRLMPYDDPQRLSLLLDSARPLRTTGRTAEAVNVLLEAIERAQEATDLRTEWRARLELAYLRAVAPGSDLDESEMLRIAEKAVTALSTVQDDEGLAIAWAIIGDGRMASGRVTHASAAYTQAVLHARRSPGHPNDAAVAWGLASVLLEDATPVPEAIMRCRELLDFGGQSQPGVLFDLSALLAMNKEFDAARAALTRAGSDAESRGARRPLLFLAHAWARLELAAGEPAAAERHARHGLHLTATFGGDESDVLNAIVLARALCRQGRFDEAEEIVGAYASGTSSQVVARIAAWNVIRAEIRAHRCAWPDAIELATRAVSSIDETEHFNLRAELRLTLAAALHGSGDTEGAGRNATEAAKMFEAKGNLVGLGRAREILALM